MAADLASTPRSGVNVQLCGDAHLSNFGLFGSPERQILFDINDFDETLPGPWEWDVKRLAASVEILGRERGFSPSDRRVMVMAGVREYRLVMRHAANLGTLEAWYDHMDVEQVMSWVRTEVAAKRLGKKEGEAGGEGRREGKDARPACACSPNAPTRSTASCGSSPDPPLIVPIDDLVQDGLSITTRRLGEADALADPEVPALARRPPPPDRGVRVRPHRAQGGRCRQRRDPRLDPPLRRTRRARPAVPPVEGSRGLGARALRRQERARPPRPAGRGRASG